VSRSGAVIEATANDGSELSLKGDGGPTCLTCPLWLEEE
jgi:arginine deiminase